MEKTLSVAAIKNGTVIDHVAIGAPLKILDVLKLPMGEYKITLGLNLPSKDIGKKGLIKIEGKELTEDEVKEIAILSPEATINIIQNYKVVKKYKVEIPKIVEGIIICPNPTCITNNERMSTAFFTSQSKKEIELQCKYCEKIFKKDEIKEYNT